MVAEETGNDLNSKEEIDSFLKDIYSAETGPEQAQQDFDELERQASIDPEIPFEIYFGDNPTGKKVGPNQQELKRAETLIRRLTDTIPYKELPGVLKQALEGEFIAAALKEVPAKDIELALNLIDEAGKKNSQK